VTMPIDEVAENSAARMQPKQVENWPVTRLLLDPANYRLPPDLDLEDQAAILNYLVDHENLEEIAESMIRSGFFAEEPLLTVAAPDHNDDTQVVVEGNRRLATLRLLSDPVSRTSIGRARTWNELAARAQESGHAFDVVPILRYAERREVLDYLGFRHVSGIVPWPPAAKARFATALVLEYGYSFRDAARAIGSRQDALRRQFVAFRSLVDLEAAGYPVDRARSSFGTYSRALQNPTIRQYMHVTEPSTVEAADAPVVEHGHEPAAAEVVGWIFGVPEDGEADAKPAVIRESRELDTLGRVLQDGDATAALRQSRDLRSAFRLAGGDREAIRGALLNARQFLVFANGQAFEFANDGQIIEDVTRIRLVLDQLARALGMDEDA
jgi:hypothetical protein